MGLYRCTPENKQRHTQNPSRFIAVPHVAFYVASKFNDMSFAHLELFLKHSAAECFGQLIIHQKQFKARFCKFYIHIFYVLSTAFHGYHHAI